jgi:hypothetical protein
MILAKIAVILYFVVTLTVGRVICAPPHAEQSR